MAGHMIPEMHPPSAIKLSNVFEDHSNFKNEIHSVIMTQAEMKFQFVH